MKLLLTGSLDRCLRGMNQSFFETSKGDSKFQFNLIDITGEANSYKMRNPKVTISIMEIMCNSNKTKNINS